MYFVWKFHRERETGLWLLGGYSRGKRRVHMSFHKKFVHKQIMLKIVLFYWFVVISTSAVVPITSVKSAYNKQSVGSALRPGSKNYLRPPGINIPRLRQRPLHPSRGIIILDIIMHS